MLKLQDYKLSLEKSEGLRPICSPEVAATRITATNKVKYADIIAASKLDTIILAWFRLSTPVSEVNGRAAEFTNWLKKIKFPTKFKGAHILKWSYI